MNKMRLSDLLKKLNLISEEDLETARAFQIENRVELSEALIRLNLISKNKLIPVLEYQTNTKYVDLYTMEIDASATKLIPENIAVQHKLVPFGQHDGKLQVAMADPLNFVARDDIKWRTGMELEVYLALAEEIERTISANYTISEVVEQAVDEFTEDIEEEPEAQAEDEDVQRAPIVRLVNSLLEQSLRSKASDIHIEPFEKLVRVRMRVDGELREFLTTPRSALPALVARIKILGSLDISEKRIPQDGRTEMTIMGRKIGFRISIIPTMYGEKIVLRLLDKSNAIVTKAQLGFTPHNLERFENILNVPEGIVLVSGPTGSGKSTTLYAALNEMNQPKRNIMTIEDPVEYQFDGINQVQVNNKAGLTFAAGLRSMLRQDPDIVMIGEIRDGETAEIATRAAITGHLVLSTIHTNDSVSTLMRLTDMGIEPFLVTSALMGVVAQRLVKRLCKSCKYPRAATEYELNILGVAEMTIYDAKGCNACGGSGYAGRIGIHEILVMDATIRTMFLKGETAETIKQEAIRTGLKTLAQSAKDLIFEGVTTVAEMLRVSYSVDN